MKKNAFLDWGISIMISSFLLALIMIAIFSHHGKSLIELYENLSRFIMSICFLGMCIAFYGLYISAKEEIKQIKNRLNEIKNKES